MTENHAIALRDITANLNGFLAATGFGVVMAAATLIFLTRIGLARSRWSAAFILLYAAFFCTCMALWAQSINFSHLWNPEAIKTLAIVAGVSIFGWIVVTIVERAPPAVLLACLAMLLICGLIGVLSIWAAPKNLLLLVAVVVVLALVAIIAVISWVLDRAHDRSVKNPRQQIFLNPGQPAEFPQIEAEPREIHRGHLLPPARKGGLPAKQNPFMRW